MKKIGFIGLGVMGHSMAAHLQDKGYQLYVNNRTKSKAEELLSKGAIWCETPALVAKEVDILFTIVGYPKDVEEVYLGKDGIITALHEGLICCDMTTTKPSLMQKINTIFAEKGVAFADAPVSGGDVGARNATLSFMVGAEEETFNALKPFFEIMGKSINHAGKPGMGQHTKMCNQIVIAGTMIGVSEALVYGAECGLDLNKMVSTISKGAAGCWTLDNLAPRVIKKDFQPGFMIVHFIKDMSIALEEAEKMELELPGLSLVKKLYSSMIQMDKSGRGKLGTQALVLAIQELSGKDLFQETL